MAFITDVLEKRPPDEIAGFVQDRLIDALHDAFTGDSELFDFASNLKAADPTVEEFEAASRRNPDSAIVPKEDTEVFLIWALTEIWVLGTQRDEESLLQAPYALWENLERAGFTEVQIAGYFERFEERCRT